MGIANGASMPVEENADMAAAHRQILEAESKLEELKDRQKAWFSGEEVNVKEKLNGEGWERDSQLMDETLEEIQGVLEELSKQHECDISLCYLGEGTEEWPEQS